MVAKKTKIFSHPIVVALVIFVLTGSSSPWWWPLLVNKSDNSEKNKIVKQNINEPIAQNVSVNPIDDGLRALMPLETGKAISDLPNGVYFFTTPLSVVYEIENPKTDFIEADNQFLENYSFEVQKVDGRYYLLGFISDESYSNLGSITEDKPLKTTLFPSRWADEKNLIAIPFDKISSISYRETSWDEHTRIKVIDLTFSGYKLGVISHLK